MKIVFLDAGTLGSDIDFSGLTAFGKVAIYDSTTEAQLPERIADANIIITNKVYLSAVDLAGAHHLVLICVTATGYDNVDIDYARSRGIAVCNVPGYSTDSVAGLTVSMALSLAFRLKSYDNYCMSGAYAASSVQNRVEPVFYELTGKTWGLYGYGSIGKRVAEIARSLGCNVMICRRTPEKDEQCVSLEELFEKSDVISLHVPLTSMTRHSINENVLCHAARRPILVNTARGAVLDEEAVVCAVKNGTLSGFATDVYDKEPLRATSPLTQLYGCENVIFTPHMAWGAYEARVRLIDEVCRNIEAFWRCEKRNRVL